MQFDPSRPPPGDNLEVRTEGEQLVMEVSSSRFPVGCAILAALIIAAGTCLAIAAGTGIFDLPVDYVLLGGILVFGGLGGVALAVAAKVVSEVLRISPETITRYYATPWGNLGEARVGAEGVEEVLVMEQPGSSSHSSVRLISDEGGLSFGGALTEEEKKWVRDCIIAVLSVDSD